MHKGEGVLTQEEIRALGGPAGFELLRDNISNGFSEGGLVDPIPAFSPKIPRIDVKPSGSDSNIQITQHITFTDSGAKVDTKGQKAIAQGMDAAMMAIIRRESRQGGFIYNELRRVKR